MILHLKPGFLTTYRKQFDLIALMQHMPVNVHGYWRKDCLMSNIFNGVEFGHTIPLKDFQRAFDNFLSLLEVKDPVDVFTCKQCKEDKQMIITCDGIQLGSDT